MGMMMFDLLLSRAEALALDSYGCDLSRLDPSQVDVYRSALSEGEDFEELVRDMAGAAWMSF